MSKRHFCDLISDIIDNITFQRTILPIVIEGISSYWFFTPSGGALFYEPYTHVYIFWFMTDMFYGYSFYVENKFGQFIFSCAR